MGRLPTFIIGGAPRSATTYLYTLCDSHPDVYMAKPLAPEPKFFIVDDDYARGLDYYSQTYFNLAGSRRAVGEKSANYLENARAARRIHSSLPDIKLIFLLRNPVDRAFSNYLWSRFNGIEDRSFRTALRLEEEREGAYAGKWKVARPFSYVSRGMYARLLQPWFDRFPLDRIKIVLFDDLVENPQRIAAEIFAFIGVDPTDVDFAYETKLNEARPDERLKLELAERLIEAYREPNEALGRLIDRDVSSWSEPGNIGAIVNAHGGGDDNGGSSPV